MNVLCVYVFHLFNLIYSSAIDSLNICAPGILACIKCIKADSNEIVYVIS